MCRIVSVAASSHPAGIAEGAPPRQWLYPVASDVFLEW